MKLIIPHLVGIALANTYFQQTAEANEASTGGASKKKEKPKISVTMEDGRTVEFPEDTKAKKAWVYRVGNVEGGALTDDKETTTGEGDAKKTVSNGKPVGVRWDFVNGKTRTVLLSDVAPLSAEFGCHGISQKGGDEYASEKDVDDAVLAFDDLMDRLKKGEWSERREGGGFGGASVLAKAIMEVFKLDETQVREYLRGLKPQEKMALRQAPELKPTIEKLEAEKAAGAKVDTSALLGKLKPATA